MEFFSREPKKLLYTVFCSMVLSLINENNRYLEGARQIGEARAEVGLRFVEG